MLSPKGDENSSSPSLDMNTIPPLEASDSLEEKVHNLQTKILFQEFELNQLKSKLNSEVETMGAR
jgi:hypothetical protein